VDKARYAEIRALPMIGGIVIAVACFAAVFAVTARFLPAFMSFASSPQNRYLQYAAGFVLAVSALFRAFRPGRDRRPQRSRFDSRFDRRKPRSPQLS
jgi:hypothetical protein